MSDSLWPYELYPARLLHSWDSPSENAEMDCIACLKGIFPHPGIKPLSIKLITIDYDVLHKNSSLELIIKTHKETKNLDLKKKWKRFKSLPKKTYTWPTDN